MHLSISGHHLDVTPALRSYVAGKLERIIRHFDQVIDVNVVMSVDKLIHKTEINLHVRGKDLFAESSNADMYAAIDTLVDKLDRLVIKHKDKRQDHGHDSIKNQSTSELNP